MEDKDVKEKIVFVLLCILTLSTQVLSAEKVITFWHNDNEKKEVWQTLVDRYAAAHPGVRIQVSVFGNEQFKQKIATVMQSGSPPDIFSSWGGGVMGQFADAGLLRDITKELTGTTWGNSMSAASLEVYRHKDKIYGVSWDMGCVGIWYNKKIFRNLGLKPFKTWTDLLTGVKKIKKAGFIPIALGERDKWPGHYWWTYLAVRIGGKKSFDDAYSGRRSFNSSTFEKAGERLVELVNLQPFQVGFLGSGYNDEAALVANGKAAMELMGQWAPNVQRANTPDMKGLGDDLGFMPFPAVEGGKGDRTDAMGGGNGFAFGKNAPVEAIDFMRFVFTPDNYAYLIKNISLVPTVKGTESLLSDPNMKTVANVVAQAKYFQLYYDQYLPPSVGEAIKDATHGIIAGKLTPKQAAAHIDKAMAQSRK
jgi:raffinose/stachyose/melibiose transport system substrate-binding protein